MFNVPYSTHNFFPFIIVYTSDTWKTMNVHMHAIVVAALFGVVATAAGELCTSTTKVFTVVVDLHASELGKFPGSRALKLDYFLDFGFALTLDLVLVSHALATVIYLSFSSPQATSPSRNVQA
jgi:hypothetical protein